jgi:hypothetical protein
VFCESDRGVVAAPVGGVEGHWSEGMMIMTNDRFSKKGLSLVTSLTMSYSGIVSRVFHGFSI